MFVIVSGPPASGKSAPAPPLATALDLPLLAKDVIKDALVDVLGAPDPARSRELGRAAVHVLLAVARTAGRGAGYFDLDRHPDELWNAAVGTPVAGAWPVLEVDTSAPVDVAALAARITGVQAR